MPLYLQLPFMLIFAHTSACMYASAVMLQVAIESQRFSCIWPLPEQLLTQNSTCVIAASGIAGLYSAVKLRLWLYRQLHLQLLLG